MPAFEDLGIEMSVVIDGRVAVEYEDEDSEQTRHLDPRTRCLAKYVEAVDGAHFSICLDVWKRDCPWAWMRDHPDNALLFQTTIDGRRMASKLCVSRSIHRRGWTRYIDGDTKYTVGEDTMTLRKFKFQAITPVEEADNVQIEIDKDRAYDMGLIRVYVYKQVATGYCESKPRSRQMQHPDFHIAEKALRGSALSHGAGYGDAVLLQASHSSSVVTSEFVDHVPVAAFFIKYRSREALKQELVIPRSPTSSPVREIAPPTIAGPGPLEPRDPNSAKRTADDAFKMDFDEDEFDRPPAKQLRLFDDEDLVDLTGID